MRHKTVRQSILDVRIFTLMILIVEGKIIDSGVRQTVAIVQTHISNSIHVNFSPTHLSFSDTKIIIQPAGDRRGLRMLIELTEKI
jgi:hypothetical protein